MNLSFRKSFARDLEQITDREFLAKLRRVIEATEKAPTLREIPHLKKLLASGKFFRIRIGQYRIGLIAEKGQIIFVRCLHRRDIYKYFP